MALLALLGFWLLHTSYATLSWREDIRLASYKEGHYFVKPWILEKQNILNAQLRVDVAATCIDRKETCKCRLYGNFGYRLEITVGDGFSKMKPLHMSRSCETLHENSGKFTTCFPFTVSTYFVKIDRIERYRGCTKLHVTCQRNIERRSMYSPTKVHT
jgi:hypothetical protein